MPDPNPNPDPKPTPDPTPQWFDGLDADLKANPSITKFKGMGDLAKSYIEIQKTLGKDKIVVPTEKSTPEEWKAFWAKAGAPDKEDGYDLNDDDVAEPIRVSAEDKAAFKKAAIEMGVPKKHLEGMFNAFKKMRENSFNQETDKAKNMRGDSETKLREKWGAAYEAKVAGAQKVIDTVFKGKELHPAWQVLSNDRAFIEGMSELAEMVSEDKIAGKARVTMTPDEAQSEYNNILGDKKHPFYNELHPEHDSAVTRMADLQAMIMAGQA